MKVENYFRVVELAFVSFDTMPYRKDRWGRTPLHWAAVNGHPSVVRALIAHSGPGGGDGGLPAAAGARDAAGETPRDAAERRAQCGAAAGRASVWGGIAAMLGGAGTTKRGRELKAAANARK